MPTLPIAAYYLHLVALRLLLVQGPLALTETCQLRYQAQVVLQMFSTAVLCTCH
jgi:hypothetical protein